MTTKNFVLPVAVIVTLVVGVAGGYFFAIGPANPLQSDFSALQQELTVAKQGKGMIEEELNAAKAEIATLRSKLDSVKAEAVMTEEKAMAKDQMMSEKEEGTMAKETMMEQKEGAMMKEEGAMAVKETPPFIRTPHYVDSFPKHDDILTQAPNELVVNFNFNLHPSSTATVTLNDLAVPVKTTISEDQFTLTIDLQDATGEGIWLVQLNACWPDGSCHDGQFAYHVTSSAITQYKDLAKESHVTIQLANISFDQPNIIISKGTKVTWVNEDPVVHFINSDPHPSHNVIPDMNSEALSKDDSYSYIFTETGEFGYHCSAHTQMVGKIVVVENLYA